MINKSRTLMLAMTILAMFMFVMGVGRVGSARESKPVSKLGKLAPHPVSIIEADIFVTKFKTTMRLRCFAEDLELIQGVEPFEDGKYDSEELLEAVDDHCEFLAENIEVLTESDEILKANIVEVQKFEIPEGGIPQGQLMNYKMEFVFEYKYEKPPEFLTVNQKIISDGLLLPSEMKILLKQQGAEQPYMHMMKPHKPETFALDWENPVIGENASEEDWEKWFEVQRNKNLGIQSYSSVYSFIYVTGYEVRHEVLIPLASLTTFIEIERANESFLEIEEQVVAAERIKALFSVGNPVVIDNVEVKPVFDRIDFYGLDLRDFAMQAEKRKVSMLSGRVGIIMSYATKGLPRDVKVSWDKFNDTVKTVDSVVIAFDKVSKTEFSTFLEDNTFEWRATDQQPPTPISNVADHARKYGEPMLSIPMITMGLFALALPVLLIAPLSRKWIMLTATGGALILGGVLADGKMVQEFKNPWQEKEEIPELVASDIFAQLHKNLFRAFDYRTESDIYDALAKSVDGELLRDLYLQINDSLRVKEQGGAVSNIETVRLLEGEKTSLSDEEPGLPGFAFRSKWDLTGTVEHWGHIHERVNVYDAEFTVRLVDDCWKITSMNGLDEEPGPVKTRTRRF